MKITSSVCGPLFLLCLLWGLFILVQYVSVYFELFWYFWWLDIVMHAYGGALIVASWFMIRALGAFPSVVGSRDVWSLWVLVAMIIGWEFFEYYYGLITPTGYVVDTVMDLGIGFGGGLASFLLFRSRTIES